MGSFRVGWGSGKIDRIDYIIYLGLLNCCVNLAGTYC